MRKLVIADFKQVQWKLDLIKPDLRKIVAKTDFLVQKIRFLSFQKIYFHNFLFFFPFEG